MKASDERRIEVLIRLEAGLISLLVAAELLGVGERQARRLQAGYRAKGPRGVVHGNRGRPPGHALSEAFRETIRGLAAGQYAGVNHTHLAELLAEREGIKVPRSTLSDILRGVGIRSPRPQKRRSRHRSRRERYPQEGMLLQIDASHHDWLQGRGPRLVLLAVIDDATGKVPAARFTEAEDTSGYFRLLRDVCKRAGVPHALYSDKHGVFWPSTGESLKEQLAGHRSPTQFGRAMAEAGIQLIAAHSPQAKGRVERLWGTLQDRLVSELRLAGATTIDHANAYLPGFLRRFNRTFSVAPEVPGSAYRPRLSAAQLDTTFCFKNERVVTNDNLVSIDRVILQILPGPNRLGYSHATVMVHESLDHRFSVHYHGRQLPTRVVPVRKLLTPQSRSRSPQQPPQPEPQQPLPWKPAPNHPWKKYPAVTKSLGN